MAEDGVSETGDLDVCRLIRAYNTAKGTMRFEGISSTVGALKVEMFRLVHFSCVFVLFQRSLQVTQR